MGKLKKISLAIIIIIIVGVSITGTVIFLKQKEDRKSKPEVETLPQPPQSVEPLPQLPQEIEKITTLEDFAKCLTERGTKFYGTYWCGWCKKQNEIFGEAAQYLPYIECTDEKTGNLTSECQKEEITGFPTWEFPEKGKVVGFQTLESLSKLSGCKL